MNLMKLIMAIAGPLLLHEAAAVLVTIGMGSESDLTLRTTITALLVIPAALWLYHRDKAKNQQGASEQAWPQDTLRRSCKPGFLLLCFLAGAVLNLAWSSLMNLVHIQEYFSNQTQESLFASAFWLQVFGLGVLIPLAEELIYRALVYQRLRTVFPVGMSAVFSSLLFALSHGNMIQILFAFPMAILLALLYEKDKRVYAPLAFHMGVNLAGVLIQYVLR